MSHMRPLLLGVWIVACGAADVPEPPRQLSVAVVTSEATAYAKPSPPAADAALPAAPPAASKAAPHRVAFAVTNGAAPCTLVLTGELVEHADVWFLRDVTRIEVEACETMQAQLLYDGAQPGVGHAEPLSNIPAIFWIKPGRSLTPDAESDFAAFSNGLQDLNADGQLDLCSVADEMSARSHVCWLFDPAKRVFGYHPELSEIPHMLVSQGKLRGWTHGGHAHESLEYAWVDGKAELVRRSTELSGADANGVPTPGRSLRIDEEIRAGKVVKKTQRVVPFNP